MLFVCAQINATLTYVILNGPFLSDLTNVLDILNEAYLDQEEQFDSTLSKENHNYVYPEPGGTEVSEAQNSNHATSVTR